MPARPPIRPGERARASRIATMLANVVHEVRPVMIETGALAALRGLALQLKALRLRLRDLDQPNGQDAVMSIARAMTTTEWNQLAQSNVMILGGRWSWIVNKAGLELRSTRRAARANRRLLQA